MAFLTHANRTADRCCVCDNEKDVAFPTHANAKSAGLLSGEYQINPHLVSTPPQNTKTLVMPKPEKSCTAKTHRVNISFPPGWREVIEAAAEKEGQSISEYLARKGVESLPEKVQKRLPPWRKRGPRPKL